MDTDTAPKQSAYAADHNQYLTFILGEEEYGIEILKVQEIKGYSSITAIPNAPRHVKGVMNLRGTVVPVVDLRAKFSMDAVAYNQFTVIIVVTINPVTDKSMDKKMDKKMDTKIVGLVVDAVSEVVNIAPSGVRPAPDFGARAETRFINGIASLGERLAVLLDIDRLLTEEEITLPAAA